MDVAQLEERELAKFEVASSILVIHSANDANVCYTYNMTVSELIHALDLLPADAAVTHLGDGRELKSLFLSQDGERVVLEFSSVMSRS